MEINATIVGQYFLSKIYDFLPCPFILTITLVPTEIFYAPQKNNIHLIKRIYIQ